MNRIYDITPEEFELIEQYLQNELSDEQTADFNARLLTDEIWQQKTDEVKLLLLGINEAALEERLNSFHSNINTTTPEVKTTGRVISFSKRWLAAASILAIVCLSVWILMTRESKYEKLFASYYTPDPGLITAMGSADDYSFEKAMVDYKEGNYKKAAEAWEKLSEAKGPSDTLNYFLGVTYLSLSSKAKANELLGQVAANSSNHFYKDACWYLGLSLLKDGETDKALDLIKKSEYPESARLINEIKNK